MPSSASAASASARRTHSRRQSTCLASKLECALRAQLRAQKQPRIPLATTYDAYSNVALVAAPPTTRLALPCTLQRPALREVDMASLADAYPTLAGVPAQYIRDRLPGSCATMRAALAAVRPISSLPKSSLPKEVQIFINAAVAAACPTHMLAVYGDVPFGQKRPVSLFPIHDLVFRTHCAALPALPPSLSAGSSSAHATLPVISLRLPSPETFALLHAYLYTHNLAVLAPPCDGDLLQLVAHAHKIHGLWRNACALGVVDERLYDAVEEAWARTLGAMEACS
ncbi:hypothetical protein GGX14DRAFT_604842 [Mycena pura]|uniref:Uncharacterized protein n=1 Tax=Mycena pura TaxID=153505 RepID=A0AAD6VLD1_9AGAR|nr:hypothetical protein GGX14DRAFT_604842 [Mycena pura]